VGCIDAETLAEMFAGGSGARTRDTFERHVDGCPRCRALVAAYARASDDSSDAGTVAEVAYAATISSVPPARAEEPRIGDLLASRYMLERVVGEGGMGVVWAANDLVGQRRVAVKMLKNGSPELAKRSWREARAATHVAHPAIVEVLDVLPPPRGAVDGAPALVMPLLEGESLEGLLRRRGRLEAREAIAILVEVVSGMHAAHERGVIHRDLKPSNVFLAEDRAGGAPVVLVLDFGLAKMLSDGTDEDADKLTRTGALLGTPHYMAPEQLFGDRTIDARADVWAIGVMLYECLSGRRPLEGRSYGQLVKSATRGAITPIEEAVPGVEPRVAALLGRMLSLERDLRPPLGEVHAALHALLTS
jgi:serine/threonine-protein kinase